MSLKCLFLCTPVYHLQHRVERYLYQHSRLHGGAFVVSLCYAGGRCCEFSLTRVIADDITDEDNLDDTDEGFEFVALPDSVRALRRVFW